MTTASHHLDPAAPVTDVRDRLANAPKGVSLTHAVLVFVIVDSIIVIALVGALSPQALPLILLLLLVLPFITFALISFLLWQPVARRFPAQPQKPDAVVRLSQSFALSTLRRMNNCVHIAADDAHLHLIPFAILRWTGARIISIPWSAIRLRSTKPRLGFLTADVDGLRMTGPEWCMRLAANTTAPDEP